MRTLIFVPPNFGHNSGAVFRQEIMKRLTSEASPLSAHIKPVDLQEEHEVSNWDDLFSLLSTYPGEFDCLVMGIDGVKAGNGDIDFRRRMESIASVTDGMPVVAYVDEVLPSTMYHLMEQDFSLVVQRGDDVRTLNSTVARAVSMRSNSGRVLRIGPVTFDLSTGDVKVNAHLLHLTGSEIKLLSILARRKGGLIPREQLLSAAYSHQNDDIPDIKIIDVFICKIRKKLNEASPNYPLLGSIVETAWGRGYRLIDYDPSSLKFFFGPLVLRFDQQNNQYLSLDGNHTYTETEIVVLDFLRNNSNTAFTLVNLAQYLSATNNGILKSEECRNFLAALAPRTPLASDSAEVMLRENRDGTWTFHNPNAGMSISAERRRAQVLTEAVKEEITGIDFLRYRGSAYVQIGTNLVKLTRRQFDLVKFLGAYPGSGFSTRDTAKTVMRLSTSTMDKYMMIMNVTAARLNERLKSFSSYLPIHIANSGHMIGMAASPEMLVPFDASVTHAIPADQTERQMRDAVHQAEQNAASTPVNNDGNTRADAEPATAAQAAPPTAKPVIEILDGPPAFMPIARGVAKGNKPFFREIDLFDTNAPQTEITIKGITLRINNRSKSSFVQQRMTGLTQSETIAFLRIFYAKGEFVAARDIHYRPDEALATVRSLRKKLSLYPEWSDLIVDKAGLSFAMVVSTRGQFQAAGADTLATARATHPSAAIRTTASRWDFT